jgi:protein SCO1
VTSESVAPGAASYGGRVPQRARLALALALAFVATAAGAVLVFGSDGEDVPLPVNETFHGAIRPPGIPPSDFSLQDERGRTVTLDDLKGRPSIVTFLYTTCDDTCPTTAQQVVAGLDRLGHDVPAVAFAVDPPRDTQATARRFVAEHRVSGRLRFLTGPERELRRQWKAYGIQRQTEHLEHSAYVILLDARGRQRVGFPAGRLTPDMLAADLERLERERS